MKSFLQKGEYEEIFPATCHLVGTGGVLVVCFSCSGCFPITGRVCLEKRSSEHVWEGTMFTALHSPTGFPLASKEGKTHLEGSAFLLHALLLPSPPPRGLKGGSGSSLLPASSLNKTI